MCFIEIEVVTKAGFNKTHTVKPALVATSISIKHIYSETCFSDHLYLNKTHTEKPALVTTSISIKHIYSETCFSDHLYLNKTHIQ
jgi:hypothetical protein